MSAMPDLVFRGVGASETPLPPDALSLSPRSATARQRRRRRSTAPAQLPPVSWAGAACPGPGMAAAHFPRCCSRPRADEGGGQDHYRRLRRSGGHVSSVEAGDRIDIGTGRLGIVVEVSAAGLITVSWEGGGRGVVVPDARAHVERGYFARAVAEAEATERLVRYTVRSEAARRGWDTRRAAEVR